MVACTASAALAHSGQPRLELGVERANPGAAVGLQGVEFEPDDAVRLALVQNGRRIAVGVATADGEGAFTRTLTLPSGLAAGTYRLVASSPHHEVRSTPLVVSGSPVGVDPNADRRTQEDGLLAPMPVASGARPHDTAGRRWTDLLAVTAGGAVLAALVITLLRRRQTSGSSSTTRSGRRVGSSDST